MININGNYIRLIKINDTVPAVVKINGSTVWEDAFSIDFKANFEWDNETWSSGCSSWLEECIWLSGFTVTANHYFSHLYLTSIIISSTYDGSSDQSRGDDYEETIKYSDGYELKSGQTYAITQYPSSSSDINIYCGCTEDINRQLKITFWFTVDGKRAFKSVTFSAYTGDLSRDTDPVLSTVYSSKISDFTAYEIAIVNSK